MSAWWFCGFCGFQNHPRREQDNTKCEQCGHKQGENDKIVRNDRGELVDVSLDDKDYEPRAGGFNA